MTQPDETLLTMLDLYAGDIDTATQAWVECKFYEAHGKLPDDARVIERVIVAGDGSYIYVHRDLKAGIQ